MSRPIAETPILTGKDAERFTKEMHRVENMSEEERAENRKRLKEVVKEAKKIINIRI